LHFALEFKIIVPRHHCDHLERCLFPDFERHGELRGGAIIMNARGGDAMRGVGAPDLESHTLSRMIR
jgi:hypothetical protein